jgi:hypothetical protein
MNVEALKLKHGGGFHWSISLWVVCPHCDYDFNALDVDDFSENLRRKQILEGVLSCRVECVSCEKEFLFDIKAGL